jgi:hypothetical protein
MREGLPESFGSLGRSAQVAGPTGVLLRWSVVRAATDSLDLWHVIRVSSKPGVGVSMTQLLREYLTPAKLSAGVDITTEEV